MKNVLLLGNGIDRAYDSHAVSWSELLKKNHNQSLFVRELVSKWREKLAERADKYKTWDQARLDEVFYAYALDDIKREIRVES